MKLLARDGQATEAKHREPDGVQREAGKGLS